MNQTSKHFRVTLHLADFSGEATREEVDRLKKLAKEKGADVIVGLGGGKAIDTSKTVANGHNLIVCPTIAATDAPTSHSAVLYTEDHQFDDYAYFIQNPSVVLMDTTVIAQAPTRFLIAGMGDALATYYEARATRRSNSNVNAGLPNGLTVLNGPHNYFHGEQVAFTTFVQLILEDAPTKEVEELLDFSLSVGLPVSLADLDVEEVNYEDILKVAQKACIPEESIHAMPFKVTPESVAQAIIAADALGRDYKKRKTIK